MKSHTQSTIDQQTGSAVRKKSFPTMADGFETDLTKLPREEQQSVRRALGDEKEPYQGCLSEGCLDKEPVWVEMVLSGYPEPDGTDCKISRCARCHKPKSYGHSFNSLGDMLAPTLKRERGMCARIVDDMLAKRPRLN